MPGPRPYRVSSSLKAIPAGRVRDCPRRLPKGSDEDRSGSAVTRSTTAAACRPGGTFGRKAGSYPPNGFVRPREQPAGRPARVNRMPRAGSASTLIHQQRKRSGHGYREAPNPHGANPSRGDQGSILWS